MMLNQLQSMAGWIGSGIAGTGMGVFLAQATTAVAAAAGAPPGLADWQGMGLGGFCIALAMYMVRESYSRRIEEQKEHTEEIKRIYAAKVDLQRLTIEELQKSAERAYEMAKLSVSMIQKKETA